MAAFQRSSAHLAQCREASLWALRTRYDGNVHCQRGLPVSGRKQERSFRALGELSRAALAIRFPGRIKRGVVHDFTESVDVSPTILDLLGAEPLPVVHGRSLRPYLERDRSTAPRDHIFSQYLENEEACVRTDRYKFILCSGKR